MTPEDFVASLDARNREVLAGLGARQAEGEPVLQITSLLRMALRNEYEAALLAAAWMTDTPEVDAQLAFARQCGDEAKHYRWIEERLRALGDDLGGFDPSAPGPSPLLAYLRTLTSTAERAAAGPFTREALAVVRNDVFAAYCDARGDAGTAELYRERIQPDEEHHHELGRRLLLRYATSADAQARAAAAAAQVLRLADELAELARLRGVCRLPGC